MGLREYHRKRDFRKTPEPRGKRAARAKASHAFLVQKHDASRLHYDFRLELDGVLKSWAVPKGPDLDPANKRLAVQVEDHPLEYGDFEGTIPQGEYGGGTVMLWDRGDWEPVGDAAEALREGHLKFTLHGEKLRGGWMLVRRGGRHASPDERNWFLFKERDEFAKPGSHITDKKPKSVATGRDLDAIAEQSDRVWGPHGEVSKNGHAGPIAPEKAKKKSSRAAKRSAGTSQRGRRSAQGAPADVAKSSSPRPAALETLLKNPAVRRAKLPTSIDVELATLAKKAPTGAQWQHEIKFDGYRMIARIDRGKAHFISRNGNDWTAKFPELAQAAGRLAVRQAIVNGEVVALDDEGVSRFQALQNVFQSGHTEKLVYYVFDILHLDGHDLTRLPLSSRNTILAAVIDESGVESIRFSDHLAGSGAEMMAEACRLHLEGIVSKRRDSPYRPGRGLDWLKIKCSQREEFVVGGFTPPSGARRHFGALALGYYDDAGHLIYAGRVGTGFSDHALAALHRRFVPLEQRESPFSNLSGSRGTARGVHWLKPEVVVEVEFSNWTDDGLLRHPSFQGVREDKPAREVVREVPISPAALQDEENHGATDTAHDRTKSAPTHVGASTADRRRKKASRKTTPPAKASPAKASRAKTSPAAASQVEIAGVQLSHPDKILYPEQNLTKLDLAHYYEQVAEWMLPHLIRRPLALVRCPGGRSEPCFFQKHQGPGGPEQLSQLNVAAHGKPEYQVAVDDLGGLIALVQMGVLEIHAWGSRAPHLEHPDRLTFDLDPDPSVAWAEVVKGAREVRLVLEELGLVAFLKTTGGKGLHLVVPIRPRIAWDAAKDFCRAVADLVVRAAPERYIATMSKAARKGKIFIDYLRNGRGATAIAPYSTRARPGAPVSVPLEWDELNSRLKSDHFTIATVPMRLAHLKHDPWAKMATTRQSITKAMRKKLDL